MTRAMKTTIRRSITGSFGRYFAILLIILLGSAFFTGLKLTRRDMVGTAQAYLARTALYDLRLVSTLGFDEQDVAAVAGCEGVLAAEGAVKADFLWQNEQGVETVLTARTLTEQLNLPDLVEGRLPQADDECLADADHFSANWIGRTIRLASSNSTDTLDAFTCRAYTVVGLARSPLYLDLDRGTSALGDGTVNAFVLLPPGGFATDYFTELYVKGPEYPLYSEEYDAWIETLEARVEPVADGSVQARYDRLVRDGQAQIDESEQELADRQAEGEAELDDADRELADAWARLTDSQAQLEAARTTLTSEQAALNEAAAQLASARAELDAAAQQIQSGASSWQEALAAGWQAYEEGKASLERQVAEGRQTLADTKAQLDAGEQTYAGQQAALEVQETQYEAQLGEWQLLRDAYETRLADYETDLADYTVAQEAWQQEQALFEAQKDSLPPEEAAAWAAALEQIRLELEQTAQKLETGKAGLEQADLQLQGQKEQLDQFAAALAEPKAQLAALRATLDEGQAAYGAGLTELEEKRAAGQATLASAAASLTRFQESLDAYYAGAADYEAAAGALEAGWQSYQQGMADYEAGLADYRQGQADRDAAAESLRDGIGEAEQALEETRQELADLEAPTLYLFDRSESNAGYLSFENDANIVERLSGLFPVFFYLIAALVCSTTMTRMVDDERTQIGVLRALGYGRGSILARYLLYAGSAAVLGCLAGYFGGGYLFPLVIWLAYGILYNIPGFAAEYDPALLAGCLAVSLLCSAGVTFLSCRHEMRSTPAALIRPKAPAAGKRILLERIPFFWRRLKFLHKVSLRNIFRFKKRMFMMLLGIAGCTALLLTGFGIRDSVANTGNYQFDDIQKYDLSVTASAPLDEAFTDRVRAACGDGAEAEAAVLLCAGELTGSAGARSVYLVASDDPAVTAIFDLHRGEQPVAWPGQGEALLSEKLAGLAGVRVGDQVTLSLSDTETATVTVAGLVENYVHNFVYLTGGTWAEGFGPFEPRTLLLRLAEGQDEYALSAALSGLEGVASVSVVTDTRNRIDNMMRSLNYVVALVLANAAALAFVVLFNLGNINISERAREIATLKVLGFYPRETGSYVYRENILLCLMGVLLGLPAGVALHRFVMDQIQVEIVAFKYVIRPQSFLLTAALVLLFSFVTDRILRRKIAGIEMAGSLKSAE